MEERLRQLRQQIAAYRGFLREGTFARQADVYLRRILETEEELRRLTGEQASKPERL
jgi:hypothetical protein